jgi:hypothetical protein
MSAGAVEIEEVATFACFDDFYADLRRLEGEETGFQARTLS